jgi:hypothetical protein
MRAWFSGLLAAAVGICLAGCGSDDGGKCTNTAGTWTITQHCESSAVGQQVTVSQTGCTITYSSPFTGWGGTVSGTAISMSGPAGSKTLACSGTATPTDINLTCPENSCTVALNRQGQPPTNIVGKACSSAGECPDPHYCNQMGFCTRTCESHTDCGCPATGSCANGCVKIDETTAVCLRRCTINSECAVGTCQAILAEGGSVCLVSA